MCTPQPSSGFLLNLNYLNYKQMHNFILLKIVNNKNK